MRYPIWPQKLRLKRIKSKTHRAVRKRRPHTTARERLRNFGLSRFRYLWFIPILTMLIVATAYLRVPKTQSKTLIPPVAALYEDQTAFTITSAKWRVSIPAGYRLAIDLECRPDEEPHDLSVILILKDEAGKTLSERQTPIALAFASDSAQTEMMRAEIDIPYDVEGRCTLSLQIALRDGEMVSDQMDLGEVLVYQ